MMLIVAHHYVVNSGLWDMMTEAPTSSKSIYIFLFGMWGKTAINCFVFITGYFMCKGSITAKKFCKLLFWILFYKITITCTFAFTGYKHYTFLEFVMDLLPINNITQDFIGCYLIFYLFIPFLNIFIRNITKQQHRRIIALCLFVYTIWYQIPFFSVGYNYVIWFSIIYLIAAYIRIYNWGISFKHWGKLSLGFITLAMLSVVLLVILGKTKLPIVYYFVSDSNSFFALVISLCTFMFFKSINLCYNRYINLIAASTFGVLLIHGNSDTMRMWLWHDVFDNIHNYPNAYVHSIVCVLLVYFICTITDFIRLHFIERPLFRSFERKTKILL